ncbi:MAG TPA: CvpA family protein [Anaerolineae bacterium]
MILNIIFDFLVLLGGLGGLLLGLRRGFIRTILGTLALFLATAFAGLIAPVLVGVFVERAGAPAQTPTGIVFAALLIAIYAILEALFRHTFPNTRIRAIGLADNVLGFLIAPVWTLLALALIVHSLGYINQALMGTPGAGLIGDWYGSSNLVVFLRDFFAIPARLLRILFPTGLPNPLSFFVTG